MTTRFFALLALLLALPVSAAPPTRIAWLTTMGGASDLRVDTARQLAYMATVNGCLAIVDVQNPAAPWIRGWSAEGCTGNAIDQQDVIVAVAGGYGGTRIYDVTNPAAPSIIGHRAGVATRVALGAGRVYALETVSGNPTMVLMRTLDLAGGVLGSVTLPNKLYRDMIRCGGRVVALGSDGYVASIDVTNDAAPVIAASRTITGSNAWQLVCDVGDPWVGRYRSLSSGLSPTLTKLDGLTLNDALFVNSSALGMSSLDLDGVTFYGSTGATLGRMRIDGGLPETSSGQASGMVGAGCLAYTAHGNISTSQQTGGLQVWDFCGGAPVPTPQSTATAPPAATVTRTATATTVGVSTPTRTATWAAFAPTCEPGCRVETCQ